MYLIYFNNTWTISLKVELVHDRYKEQKVWTEQVYPVNDKISNNKGLCNNMILWLK